MHRTAIALLLMASTAQAAAPKAGKTPGVPDLKQWELKNGLKVVFVPDHKAPVVTVQVFFHAGGKDEPADKRGMAHMFEHMMFKGSDHVPPEEHARFIQLVGGDNNAFTEDDVTGYHNTVPPAALEFTLKLEAERMRNLKLTQKTIDSEREVVKEELRLRLENNPLWQAIDKELHLAFQVHPYRQMAIGEKKMLDTVTPADCQKFYDKFYRPNNAALIVVGDTDEATVRKLVDQYFGPLERGPEIKRDYPQEPAQSDVRTASLSLPVQLPFLIGGYHVPASSSDDLYALEVMEQILSSGESSRLHQRLVRKDKLAVAAGGQLMAHEEPGLFLTFAAYLPSSDVEKIKTAFNEEIDKIISTPVDAKELAKAKNQLAARAVYLRERVSELATTVGYSTFVAHDPLRPFVAPAKYDAVTAADVQRVAKKYLVKTNFSQVTLIPTPPKGGAK